MQVWLRKVSDKIQMILCRVLSLVVLSWWRSYRPFVLQYARKGCHPVQRVESHSQSPSPPMSVMSFRKP